MNQTDPTANFDGCRRACRQQGAHTLVWGECEHALEPEPTVSLSRVYTDTDGRKSIGFDRYSVTQLAELIEPALRTINIHLGPNAIGMLERGETVSLSVGEYASLALAAADAIVHRHDEPAAASAVVSPPTDRAACVAAALREHGMVHLGDQVPADEYDCCADAVLAVLGEQADQAAKERDFWKRQYDTEHARHVAVVGALVTDRAAVLRWAADELGRMDYDTDSNDYGYDTYRDAWNGGVMDGAERLRRLAVEAHSAEAQQPEPTPCSQPNPCEDGELCATHEEEQAHADCEHELCGVTCEVAMPTELMRNSLIAWAPPGGKGILAELERRAAAGQPAAVPQRAYPDCERCGDTGIDPEQDSAPCPACQQSAAEVRHAGGNAEDCLACIEGGLNKLGYPWTCPGEQQAAAADDEETLVHVGWWCWRGDNHGHLATMACRSDNVPIHVPAEWADEMRAVLQRIEDGEDDA